MFENVLSQSASSLLEEDINRGMLPGSILLAGPAASGKLTTALELARILSCKGETKGLWTCTCASCQKHKALVSPNVLVVGPGDRSLEIAAARNTLLFQNASNTKHLEAARYLYLRAVRKLTVRFNPILWEGDDKLNKFSPLLQAIDESLEELEPGRTIPEADELEKIIDDITKNTTKLEDSFLYDALPVSQIRNISAWAHLAANDGKRVVIIENADRMADSARNALLKILEEPPEDTQFVLTTTRRGAMLPTILSRVRTYSFFERSTEQQQGVIDRVFHYQPLPGMQMPKTIDEFLQTFLPIQPTVVKQYAQTYYTTIAEGHVPDMAGIVKGCGGFDPRVLFRIFIEAVINAEKKLAATPEGAEASAQLLELLRKSYNNVTVYNQNPLSALEELTRNLLMVNHQNNGVFKEAIQKK